MGFAEVKTRLGLLFEAHHYFSQSRRIRGLDLIDMIGQGGMGMVYRGTNPKGELVALKVIAGNDQKTSDELRDRYRREVHTMKRVQGLHPTFPDIQEYGDHVVKIKDVDITFPTITMPLYHGRNLSKTKVEHPFCYVEAVCRVLEGLDVLHDHDIRHRDIKPDNIFVTWDDEVKLLDYGIAKGEFMPDLTSFHGDTVVGSIHYMAPEQFSEDSSQIDQRTDIYGAGMCLYALVSQNPLPIPGSDPRIQFHNVIKKRLPKVSESLPIEWQKYEAEVRDIDEMISKMIEKDKTDRYSSAQEALKALGPFRRGHINNYVMPIDLRLLVHQATHKKIPDNVFSQVVKKRYGDILWLPVGLTEKLAEDPEIPVFLPDRIKPAALKKDNWKIGRGKKECDILLIEKDGGASRSHALVKRTQGRYQLRDLMSSNGTFLGDSDGPNMKFIKCSDTQGYDLRPLQWVRFGGTVRRFVPSSLLRTLILNSLTTEDNIDPGATNIIKFE